MRRPQLDPADGIKAFAVLLGELHVETGVIVPDLRQLASADDRNDWISSVSQPGQWDLGRRMAGLARHRDNFAGHRFSALVRFHELLKRWITLARVFGATGLHVLAAAKPCICPEIPPKRPLEAPPGTFLWTSDRAQIADLIARLAPLTLRD